MAAGLFITGTDTGVGKTVVARLIVRSMVASAVRVAVMKPVAAGGIMTEQGLRNEDALGLIADCNVVMPYASVNPYCLSAPVSPHLAARDMGMSIELQTIQREFCTLAAAADVVIVEGAGGWLAPLNDRQFVADLAVALELPVVLVVGLRLGCLNHALLSAQAIRQRGASLAGWIGNQIDGGFARLAENVATLQQHLGMAPIAIVAHASHRHEAGCLPAAAVAALMRAATPKQLT
jgi:dethiobiotin synthetase